MHLLRSTSIALLICATSTAAIAADMLSNPVGQPHMGATTLVEYGTGWYLRGDVGATMNKVEGVDYRQGTTAFTGAFETFDLDESTTFGAGFGYQLTDNIRVDATYKHHGSANFTGSSAQGVTCGAGTCDYVDNTTFSADTYMVNAYVDLKSFAGMTPYIGAGAGMAKVEWGDLSNSQVCATGTCTFDTATTHAGTTEERFAYSLHTGFAFDIAENMKMDLGYSFTQIDGGSMFDFEATNAMSGQQGKHGALNIHSVQAGVRYSIW